MQFRPIVLQFSLPRSPYASNITNIHNYYIVTAFTTLRSGTYMLVRFLFLFVFYFFYKGILCCVYAGARVCIFLFCILPWDCSRVLAFEGETGFEEL